jgi:lysozyme family protein
MPSLTNALRAEYEDLFRRCQIRPAKLATVNALVDSILANRSRYLAAGAPLGVPWYFIGAVHSLESSLKFDRHLHNGDPLSARTVHVPAGRPPVGSPPFTWEVSASDALKLRRLDTTTDWSLAGTLFQLEAYNGFGYRNEHPEVLSPYLWSFSTHYTKGKFVADGVFSPDAVSQQCGAAVLLRRMAERRILRFDRDGNPIPDADPSGPPEVFDPLVTFRPRVMNVHAKEFQQALNRFPGIFLEEDGFAGEATSEALRRVTGHLLQGDPRAASPSPAGLRVARKSKPAEGARKRRR